MTAPTFNFGIVLRALEHYQAFVNLVASSPLVAITDFTYAAPIYKGSAAIRDGLAGSNTALEKFDMYFTRAILDDTERARYAELFMASYLRRYPASERSDLFLASGDVMRVDFELVSPLTLPEKDEILAVIGETPHDAVALGALREGAGLERAHLVCGLKLFLDNVKNPRRHDVPAVEAAARELGVTEPYVAEIVTDGAAPGYVSWALHPLVEDVGGRLVVLA